MVDDVASKKQRTTKVVVLFGCDEWYAFNISVVGVCALLCDIDHMLVLWLSKIVNLSGNNYYNYLTRI